MPTRNINLTDHFDRFVAEQVESGRYKNASEVMRAGLRLLEKRAQRDEQTLVLLRRLAAEGFAELDHGQGILLKGDKELSNFIGRVGQRAGKTAEKQIAKRAEKSPAKRAGKSIASHDGP